MKNYFASGKQIKFTVPRGVSIASGEPYMHGNLFGVSMGAYSAGDDAILERFGIFDLAKDNTEAIADKADLYFDSVNKRLTAKAVGPYVGQANGAAAETATTVQAFIFGKGEGGDSGGSISLTAPSGGVVAGVGYIIGSMFVVALETKDEAEAFEAKIDGVVTLAKNNSVATTEGQEIFWDDTNKEVTPTSASGLYSIGHALTAQANTDTEQSVHLSGVKVVAVS